MLKKIVVALFAVALLSGCTSATSGKQPHVHVVKDHGNKHIVEFEKVIGDRVFFALNSSSISPLAHATLARQAEWLKEHHMYNVTIEGHCDERGTREFNIALGERRAHSVKKSLMKHGVDGARMDTVSYGKERPAVIGDSEESFSQNRRSVTAIK